MATQAAQPIPVTRPSWRHSLKTRIALGFGLVAAVVATALGIAIYVVAEKRAFAAAETSLLHEQRRASAEVRALLQAVGVSASTLANAVAGIAGNEAQTLALLRATVESEPNSAGGLVALDAEASPLPGALWAQYATKRSQGVAFEDLVQRGVNVSAQDWYRQTLETKRAWWSAPYFNETAGGRWMLTLNQPLALRDGRTPGMVSLDVPIDRFNSALILFRDQKNFRAVLHKGDVWVGDSDWLSVGTPPPAPRELIALLDAQRQTSPATTGVSLIAPGLRGTYETLGQGWGVMVLMDEAKVREPLHQAAWRIVLGTLIAIGLLALFSNALARRLTQPLMLLGGSAQKLAQDGYAMPTELLVRKDEIGQLARVLDAADSTLRQQLARSQRLAQEQQKLDSELRLAHDLQQSMLPPSTAVDVHGGHLDIHAVLKPAKSVGGDFYAFHPREDGMVWFAIGDISDKGVPAALFMARTVAVLEATARNTDSPSMMLSRAAPRLAEGNESCMFATALCGLIDPHTGLFELASSGHELPLIVRADGRIELFEMETGPPLGIDPDAYGDGFAGMLAPGDCLFCFTDGVTEARDRSGQMFGEDRLREALSGAQGAEALVASVMAAVEAFSAGADPADDITVLAVSLAAPNTPTVDPLHFSLWPAGLRAMDKAIDDCLASQGIDAEGVSDVRLVLEELIANAIDHGGASDCTVDMAFTELTITLRIADDGHEFNPLDAPDLELDENDFDRPIGGLGLHLIKTMSLDAAYRRENDKNHLTLVLPRNPP